MKYAQYIKTKDKVEVIIPLKANEMKDLDMQPGKNFLSFTDDGEPYGVFGCVEIPPFQSLESKTMGFLESPK